MNKKIALLIIINILFGYYTVFSQNTIKKLTIPDSLLSKKYSELYEVFTKNCKDTSTSVLYLSAYLKKGVLDIDSLEISKAYSFLSFYEKNDSIKLSHINKAISYGKNLSHTDFLAWAYNVKGIFYLDRWKYSKALKYYLQTLDYSRKSGNLAYVYHAKHNIGILKSKLGKYHEALDLFKESLRYEEQKKELDTLEYIESIHSISEVYSDLKQIDSSNWYLNKGLSILTEDIRMIRSRLLLIKGINLYHQKKYKEAYTDILKTTADLSKIEDKTDLVKSYFYIGKILENSTKTDAAISYYNKIDSIFQSSKYAMPEVRGSYISLLELSKQNNHNKDQLLYIERLLHYDSIVNSTNWQLNEELFKEYDTPQLLLEKEKLIQSNNRKYQYLTLGFLFLFSITAIMLSFQYRKRKTYTKRFEKLLVSNKETTNNIEKTEFSSIDTIGISSQIIDEISLKIDQFEANQDFLKPNITTTSLAAQLNTNVKYISKVIHHTKGKKFTNYINSLRINYVVEKLKTDRKFRNYTIKAIASEGGFSNTTSFSKCFYENTGLYPSFFIKQLHTNYHESKQSV